MELKIIYTRIMRLKIEIDTIYVNYRENYG